MKLIDKDAVLAEIEELKTAIDIKLRSSKDSAYWKAQSLICERLEFKVNSLEVEEADINKEISQFIDANFEKATIGHKLSLRRTAKHFFELGLRASNPLTWENISMIREIFCGMVGYPLITDKEVCKEVLKRFNAQKGE